jgi:hypothetical protein
MEIQDFGPLEFKKVGARNTIRINVTPGYCIRINCYLYYYYYDHVHGVRHCL